jgi:hypothetical protein
LLVSVARRFGGIGLSSAVERPPFARSHAAQTLEACLRAAALDPNRRMNNLKIAPQAHPDC